MLINKSNQVCIRQTSHCRHLSWNILFVSDVFVSLGIIYVSSIEPGDDEKSMNAWTMDGIY